MTDDTTNGMETKTLQHISTRYITTAVVTALSSSTLTMASSTSENHLKSKPTTLPLQTNLQNNANARSTRGAKNSAPLTTLTTLSSPKNINMNTYVTHHGLITGSTRGKEKSASLTLLTSLSSSKEDLSTHATNQVFTTGSTKRTEKSTSLTTRSFLSPSKEIMNSHVTSHTSNMYDTMTTDAKLVIISTESPQLTSAFITLSTSSSSLLTQTLYTDKPILNTVTGKMHLTLHS